MPIWNSSVSTGWTGWPSLATTVIATPGSRTLKLVIAAALMMRSRTGSPGGNSAVQLSSLAWPLIR